MCFCHENAGFVMNGRKRAYSYLTDGSFQLICCNMIQMFHYSFHGVTGCNFKIVLFSDPGDHDWFVLEKSSDNDEMPHSTSFYLTGSLLFCHRLLFNKRLSGK